MADEHRRIASGALRDPQIYQLRDGAIAVPQSIRDDESLRVRAADSFDRNADGPHIRSRRNIGRFINKIEGEFRRGYVFITRGEHSPLAGKPFARLKASVVIGP